MLPEDVANRRFWPLNYLTGGKMNLFSTVLLTFIEVFGLTCLGIGAAFYLGRRIEKGRLNETAPMNKRVPMSHRRIGVGRPVAGRFRLRPCWGRKKSSVG